MTFLRDIAVVLFRENKPLSWTAPTGFPWLQCYREFNTKRLRFSIHGKRKPVQKTIAVGYRDTLRARETRDGVAANFVHACDAAHLILTVNAAIDAGVTDIAVVHDCFGCHASEADRVRKIILRTFVQMYEQNDVLAEILLSAKAVTNKPLPDLPGRGMFDIKQTLKAPYAFQ
jgi:Autographiviridae RNA polymerase